MNKKNSKICEGDYLKLVVTDLDGTLLNSQREISKENSEALLAAQQKGIEIAVATGRTYANALGLCQRAGLTPHIISNHGAFAYTNKGKNLLRMGIDKEYVKHAMEWLTAHHYFYSICTDTHSFIPANTRELFHTDYQTAIHLIPEVTENRLQQAISIYLNMDGKTMLENMMDLLETDLTIGSITSITFDQDRLNKGREYFNAYPFLAMTVAGRDIFEMIHPDVSKGHALKQLVKYLHISLDDVMAIGDNYNDLSMLEAAGISVAIGNAEPDIKKRCRYVSLTNDQHGVAYIINKLLCC